MAAEKRTREVITLQVGNYSNFVGAHFWNLQEALFNNGGKQSEINHDILYREGRNIADERTFKPRVICFDLKGNVSNSKVSSEHSDGLESPTWEGTVEKYDRSSNTPDKLTEELQELRKQSIYLGNQETRSNLHSTLTCSSHSRSFEESITSWLDYSHVDLHEKSFHMIEGIHKEEGKTFGNFGSGQRIFESQKFQNDFEDNLHFFAEECDRLQGFQIFSDIHDCFGGLTSGILQELAEEYSKKICLCFPTMPAVFADDTRHAADMRLLSTLLGIPKYVDNSSQVVPISLRNSFGVRSKPVTLPWIDYKPSSNYHTSAILATAIDTVTLSGRLAIPEPQPSPLTESPLENTRKISSLSVSLPIQASSTFTPAELLKDYEHFSSQFTSLTPDVCNPSNIASESVVIRGIPSHLLQKNDYPQILRQLYSLLRPVVNSSYPSSYSGCVVEQPCQLTPLFPEIFKPSVTPVGCVVDYSRVAGHGVQKTSAMTRLQSCGEISHLLEGLITGAKQANIKRQPSFLEEGIEAEDFQTSLENAAVMAQCYHNKYEL